MVWIGESRSDLRRDEILHIKVYLKHNPQTVRVRGVPGGSEELASCLVQWSLVICAIITHTTTCVRPQQPNPAIIQVITLLLQLYPTVSLGTTPDYV